MFVIVQAWESLTEEEKKKDTKEKIGYMLKHAGVSITVTSITDIVAFAVGASTVRRLKIHLNLISSFFLFN